ncbi:MAG TPA: hypothetical protein VMR52_05930 [Dehalococcoidia bacterium]|nr:hypothetical protein [Dehalococcoidia bacterium]
MPRLVSLLMLLFVVSLAAACGDDDGGADLVGRDEGPTQSVTSGATATAATSPEDDGADEGDVEPNGSPDDSEGEDENGGEPDPGDSDEGGGDGEPGAPSLGEGGEPVDACELLTDAQVESFLGASGTVAFEGDDAPIFSCNWQRDGGEGLGLSVASGPAADVAEVYFDFRIDRPGVVPVPGVGDQAYWQELTGNLFILHDSYVIELAPFVSQNLYASGEELRAALVDVGHMVIENLSTG